MSLTLFIATFQPQNACCQCIHILPYVGNLGSENSIIIFYIVDLSEAWVEIN